MNDVYIGIITNLDNISYISNSFYCNRSLSHRKDNETTYKQTRVYILISSNITNTYIHFITENT